MINLKSKYVSVQVTLANVTGRKHKCIADTSVLQQSGDT